MKETKQCIVHEDTGTTATKLAQGLRLGLLYISYRRNSRNFVKSCIGGSDGNSVAVLASICSCPWQPVRRESHGRCLGKGGEDGLIEWIFFAMGHYLFRLILFEQICPQSRHTGFNADPEQNPVLKVISIYIGTTTFILSPVHVTVI